jgi:hypothetical protein
MMRCPKCGRFKTDKAIHSCKTIFHPLKVTHTFIRNGIPYFPGEILSCTNTARNQLIQMDVVEDIAESGGKNE